MAGETVITVVGNLTSDPELRFTPNGAAVANFTVASTPRMFDRQSNEFKDGETLFLRCSVWREMGENVAESLQRGTRVVVQGRLKSRSFETKEGEKRTVMELDVDEVGPSLRRATAQVTKNERSGGGFSGGGNFGGQQQGGGAQQGGFGQQQSSGWGNNPQQGNPNQGGSQQGGQRQGGYSQGNNAPANDPWASSSPQGGNGGWGNPGADEPPF
ncbi:MAG: single-stranded DNA-binding protein [Brevibacterium aurantiacum]|uniref:Single-stranded DNA-binding protein n=1 Tax=Brevibacterium aurantiacum TaxID=273384 RepID=A0A1D7W941_BREAU|nr:MULTISPECIES: single-stranded DNA-binding protein [Brevibacterium]AOP55524.1 Single-stranded DNA-binding protein [Brevibacterium aurantiacum]AZL11013.1 single-stranded DNA-binding protein [Brevibacterium aurantiacum]AZT98941.1 single-stranded DNA-binding protein [Brevibacterium aurantiacum]MDN5774948.1 single-stranded DNA-binding protein [Brevibacterium aurantiacum]PCC48376.1 single-stranded DNA-binding protein [Brevibacterium aurantiacum]